MTIGANITTKRDSQKFWAPWGRTQHNGEINLERESV